MVDAQGHNLIATAPGSNRRLTVADIQALERQRIRRGDLLNTTGNTSRNGRVRITPRARGRYDNDSQPRSRAPIERGFSRAAAHHHSQRDRGLAALRRHGDGSGHRPASRRAPAGDGMSNRASSRLGRRGHCWYARERYDISQPFRGDAGRYHRRGRCVQWCASGCAPRRACDSSRRSCAPTPPAPCV